MRSISTVALLIIAMLPVCNGEVALRPTIGGSGRFAAAVGHRIDAGGQCAFTTG